MNTAMNIGIVAPIIVFNRFNHRKRLLRGGRVIQVNQRLAMHSLLQDRKIFPDFLHVVFGSSMDSMRYFCDSAHSTSSQFLPLPSPDLGLVYVAASGIPAATSFSRWSRSCGEFMRSRHSLAKASK